MVTGPPAVRSQRALRNYLGGGLDYLGVRSSLTKGILFDGYIVLGVDYLGGVYNMCSDVLCSLALDFQKNSCKGGRARASYEGKGFDISEIIQHFFWEKLTLLLFMVSGTMETGMNNIVETYGGKLRAWPACLRNIQISSFFFILS